MNNFNEFHINLLPIIIAPPKKWWGNFDQNTKFAVTLITSNKHVTLNWPYWIEHSITYPIEQIC